MVQGLGNSLQQPSALDFGKPRPWTDNFSPRLLLSTGMPGLAVNTTIPFNILEYSTSYYLEHAVEDSEYAL